MRLFVSSAVSVRKNRAQLATILKRSEFLLSGVRAYRGLVVDLRTLARLMKRRAQIAAYLKTHSVRKLQLGTSESPLEGWLNTDLDPVQSSVVYMNAAKRFPFEDNTFDYVIAEQMIEHVEYEAAQSMLRECFRVLRPGGRVRFATPDLGVVLGLHHAETTSSAGRFVESQARQFLPYVKEGKDVFVINHMFRAWGHCFLYDQQTLYRALHTAGFREIRFYSQGESEDPVLRNIESHGRRTDSEDLSRFISTVAEGCKDGVALQASAGGNGHAATAD